MAVKKKRTRGMTYSQIEAHQMFRKINSRLPLWAIFLNALFDERMYIDDMTFPVIVCVFLVIAGFIKWWYSFFIIAFCKFFITFAYAIYETKSAHTTHIRQDAIKSVYKVMEINIP